MIVVPVPYGGGGGHHHSHNYGPPEEEYNSGYIGGPGSCGPYGGGEDDCRDYSKPNKQ